jgi:hypothetical protein
MTRCVRCANPIVAGDRFCRACGTPWSVRCRTCTAPLEEVARFCGTCGQAAKPASPLPWARARSADSAVQQVAHHPSASSDMPGGRRRRAVPEFARKRVGRRRLGLFAATAAMTAALVIAALASGIGAVDDGPDPTLPAPRDLDRMLR